MGAIRSAYSAPVCWRQGQTEPDTIIWYFAGPCASEFPDRHRFASHYHFPHDAPQTAIGEQEGPRPYNKGNGPLGAPRLGFHWKGEVEWFAEGVPADVPPVPLNCEVQVFPVPNNFIPPLTWGKDEESEMVDGFGIEFVVMLPTGPLSWEGVSQYPPFNPLSPNVTIDLHPGTDGGMELDVAATDPSTGATIPTAVAFVDTVDDLESVTWRWRITGLIGIPVDWFFAIDKCGS